MCKRGQTPGWERALFFFLPQGRTGRRGWQVIRYVERPLLPLQNKTQETEVSIASAWLMSILFR